MNDPIYALHKGIQSTFQSWNNWRLAEDAKISAGDQQKAEALQDGRRAGYSKATKPGTAGHEDNAWNQQEDRVTRSLKPRFQWRP